MDHDESVNLRLSGNRRSIDNVLTLLGFLAECSRAGTTQWVQLMVDGDGGFALALDIEGREVRLADEVATHLFADADEGRTPSAIAHLDFRRAAGLDLRDETVLIAEWV